MMHFCKTPALWCFQEHGDHLQVARIVFWFRIRRLGQRALLYSAIEKRPGGSFCNNDNNRRFDVSWMRKIFKITAIFPENSQNFISFWSKFQKKNGGNHFAKTTYLATNFYEDDTLFQNSCFFSLEV
jgi:hypothetical protein